MTALAVAAFPLTLAAAPASAAPAAPRPAAPAVSIAKTKLFVLYRTRRTCTVYPNHKMKGTPWRIPAGQLVIWRYNRDRTWAIISDPHRAKETFPWWGVTRRGCIGKSIRQSGYPAGGPAGRTALAAGNTIRWVRWAGST